MDNGICAATTSTLAEAQWEEIAVLPADSAVFTDTALAPHTTYWHRVRAFNEHGYSAYSNESFNSTISLPPNPDEQYLMVLINEARAAPEAFGYPELEPVPPLAYHANLAYSARAHSQSVSSTHRRNLDTSTWSIAGREIARRSLATRSEFAQRI